MRTDLPITGDLQRGALALFPDAKFFTEPTRRELLDWLAEHDYVASAEAIPPLRMWLDPASRSSQSSMLANLEARGRDLRLQAEVHEFARNFFSIAPQDRTTQWEVLRAKHARESVLGSWLDRLKPGLFFDRQAITIDPTASPGWTEMQQRFVAVCCDSFVAPYPHQARIRQDFLWDSRERLHSLRVMICELRERLPEFFNAIAGWSLSILRPDQKETNSERYRRLSWRLQESLPKPAPVPQVTSEGNYKWVIGIVLFVVFRILYTVLENSKPDPNFGPGSNRSVPAPQNQGQRIMPPPLSNPVNPTGSPPVVPTQNPPDLGGNPVPRSTPNVPIPPSPAPPLPIYGPRMPQPGPSPTPPFSPGRR